MFQLRHLPTGKRGFAKWLLSAFFPVLALGAVTTLSALAAGLSGWYAQEMLMLAASVGSLTSLLALLLSFLYLAERKATGRALIDVEARIGGLLESAMDAIITVDEQQRIVQYNAAAEKVFGWPREAVLGQPLEKLIPARFRGDHRAHIERFGSTGVTSRRMGDRTVVMGIRANGEEFPLEASISQLNEKDHKLFTVILRDITERTRAEQQQARSEVRLRGILDSAMDASSTVMMSASISCSSIPPPKWCSAARARKPSVRRFHGSYLSVSVRRTWSTCAVSAMRLTWDLKNNPPGIALALDLLDEINDLKAQLAQQKKLAVSGLRHNEYCSSVDLVPLKATRQCKQ